jgi:hypothetical protein
MPALPSPGLVIKANVNWGVDGDSQAQTLHFFRYSGAPNPADLLTLAELIVSSGASWLQSLATSFTGMLGATVRDLSSDMGLEVSGGTPWVGTRTGDRLSPGTAAVVGHTIRRHYRGGHARTYLPLGSGTDVASTGLWADAFVSAVDTAFGNFIGELSPGGFDLGALCQVSYYGPPNRVITSPVTGRARTVSTVRAEPIVNDITSSSTRKKIGSQRRRNKAA